MILTDDAEINSKPHSSHTLETTHMHDKSSRPNREHRCNAGQVPSKGQVRISHNSRVPEWGKYAYLDQ